MEQRTLTKHYFISGRVQGVGFRAFTQALATRLQLKGWVRNLDDGRVEAKVQGAANVIAEFENELRRGPPHGKVAALEVQDGEAEDATQFRIV